MWTWPLFADRTQAGLLLARLLRPFLPEGAHPLVLALPRGGVPVAVPVAEAFHGNLDICLVRKLGVPGHDELAMGAIASGGHCVWNADVISDLQIPKRLQDQELSVESRELERRELLFRGHNQPPRIQGRTVILVDDGLATGATMLAAAEAIRAQHPERLIIALPVAPPGADEQLAPYADAVVIAEQPYPFGSVGAWYTDFTQVTDEEVRATLAMKTPRPD